MIRPSPLLEESVEPTAGSPRDRDNRFYRLLAGGAKTRLLEGFLQLRLPNLLGEAGPLPAAEICRRLNLDPTRGWKFLHLLALVGLLHEENPQHCGDDAVFGLSDESKEYFGEHGGDGYFFRDLVQYWRNVAVLPLNDVLHGMPLPEAVRWPPPSAEAAEHLETWMRVTSEGAIQSLVRSGAMADAEKLLDVGGGDGTIACALVKRYPQLDATVFNLPASAEIARRTIAGQGCTDRVHVFEGDFLRDELPTGFDRVMFSRVLTDWTPDVCQMLFHKVRRALADGGRLIINEALVEGNVDYTIAWEFRYLFYDTFGRTLLKPLSLYEQLLEAAGHEIVNVTPMSDESFYSVVEAVVRD